MNHDLTHNTFAAGRWASLLALSVLGAAVQAQPAPQTAFLERGETQASGGQIRSYGVPTTDSTGVVKYWDVTVDLTVGVSGKPAGNATVTAVAQPKVRTNRLIAGTYSDGIGGSCTINSTTLPSGRQEASGSCKNGNYVLNFTVNNGDIAGHPFELQLLSAGINNIPGYRDYNWGIDGLTTSYYGSCFGTNYVISARQVGPQIVLTRYAYDNIGDCGMTLTKTP